MAHQTKNIEGLAPTLYLTQPVAADHHSSAMDGGRVNRQCQVDLLPLQFVKFVARWVTPSTSTQTPYSKFLIRQYIENAHRDIYDIKQLRLVICTKRGRAVGLIDVFDLDIKDQRAALGILIADPKDRKK